MSPSASSSSSLLSSSSFLPSAATNRPLLESLPSLPPYFYTSANGRIK
jgi:hypothetical protein